MNTLIAIVCFVLSLAGVDVGSHTVVDRIRIDGADTLYSKVVARPDVTRFECVHSASGQCYYSVYPRQCTSRSAAVSAATRTQGCRSQPLERFVLATGDSRQIAALPGFRLCVSAEQDIAAAGCEVPELLAYRGGVQRVAGPKTRPMAQRG